VLEPESLRARIVEKLQDGLRAQESRNTRASMSSSPATCILLGAPLFSTADLDYFSATHRAYRPVAGPEGLGHRCYVAAEDLVVRRTILFVKDPGYF